jgi:hypothetical protein
MRRLSAKDILAPADYEKIRAEKRRSIMATKEKRRLFIGPYATMLFENFDTMWLQVQEMLRIEKGGEDQLTDELKAYNPMIPNGSELTATVMFEIEDAERRKTVLDRLGGIEQHIELRLGREIIQARAEQDLNYTSEEGKASSVQFVHFPFTSSQIMLFRATPDEILIAFTHPHYGHRSVMPPVMRDELSKDFGPVP